MNSKEIITFVDHIGRTLIGEKVEDTDGGKAVVVKNPAIIHVQPTPQGQLNVQTIPLYFREFVGEKNKKEGTIWKFFYDSIVLGINVENDTRLLEQYDRLFSDAPAAAPAAASKDERVVKLFED
jgi:hypothetical protein